MRLLTIGDSLSQGVMSYSTARTDLCYSTLIAQKMGLSTGSTNAYQYYYPEWKYGGMPFCLEKTMRKLNKCYGNDIRNIEWLFALKTINDEIDICEEYYERGEGSIKHPAPGGIQYYNNISIRGFDIADSWLVTPELCKKEIKNDFKGSKDYTFGAVNKHFYRNALRILDPSQTGENFSQIDWLNYHATNGDGLENLILWLGNNNALGAILKFQINPTKNDPNDRPHNLTHSERFNRGYNLWHPDDFKEEYKALLDKVDAIMQNNKSKDWKVFIGTIPYVTIVPFAKGVGKSEKISGMGTYYKYYTYFPFEEDFAVKTGYHLAMQDAIHIDTCIKEYNKIINDLVTGLNSSHKTTRYFIVDTCKTLSEMAYKRNDCNPTYKYPPFFDFIYPKVNTKYYHADQNGRLKQGGIFSLDGVHPSAIGQGIIAHEFLSVMQNEGISLLDNKGINWCEVFESDTLYNNPITNMQEIYQHEKLADFIVKTIQCIND